MQYVVQRSYYLRLGTALVRPKVGEDLVDDYPDSLTMMFLKLC
jgi:hypothetical protein